MNRQDFPVLKTVTYLDSAAGMLKPTAVIRAISDFYRHYPINSRSDDSRLGAIVTGKITEARALVADLVGAAPEEVIFTSGTTDGLNKLAFALDSELRAGDEILISNFNHASAVLPFLTLAARVKARVVYATDVLIAITPRTKLIVAAQMNNTVQSNLDWDALYARAHAQKALLINDAAQSIAHTSVALAKADAIVFSSNKLYGPTGSGALIVRRDLLARLQPAVIGGGSFDELEGVTITYKKGAPGFEAGTLNTAGIIGLGAAIKYFNSLSLPRVMAHEHAVATYAYNALAKIPGVSFYTRFGDPIIIFNIAPFNPQDIVSYLGQHDIILRGGLHCARLLGKVMKYEDSVRLSLGGYNTTKDIDKLIAALAAGRRANFLDFV